MLSVQPDSVLCGLSARGNEDAFAVLYARHRQPVFAFVFHLLGRGATPEDAEDITQEVFQKAYANLAMRHGDSFKAWIMRIARNRTFDQIRGRKPRSISLDDPEAAPEPSNVVSLHAEVEHRAELVGLLAAIGELPERQREALVMRELGGFSTEEIAESLETTTESAKQLVKRGRAAVSAAADSGGRGGRGVGRKLASVAPITSIVWLGSGKTGAAAAAAGAATTGAATSGAAAAATGGVAAAGAAAGGAGATLAVGKIAATVLAVAAIGTGGVVASEQVKTGGGDAPVSERLPASGISTARPRPSDAPGSQSAKANRRAADARRERARKRAADRRRDLRARRKLKAERSAQLGAKRGAGGPAAGSNGRTGRGVGVRSKPTRPSRGTKPAAPAGSKRKGKAKGLGGNSGNARGGKSDQ
jgi:RNA polymerase sigma factor (sigma-70 family)